MLQVNHFQKTSTRKRLFTLHLDAARADTLYQTAKNRLYPMDPYPLPHVLYALQQGI